MLSEREMWTVFNYIVLARNGLKTVKEGLQSWQIVGRPNQDLGIIKGENLCITGPNDTMCNLKSGAPGINYHI